MKLGQINYTLILPRYYKFSIKKHTEILKLIFISQTVVNPLDINETFTAKIRKKIKLYAQIALMLFECTDVIFETFHT